jgi:hypothetical protein
VRAVMASVSLADSAAHLLRDTLWRPALTFPRRSWRTWRLRRKAPRLYGDYWPSTLPKSAYRNWIKESKGKLAGRIPRGRMPGIRQPRAPGRTPSLPPNCQVGRRSPAGDLLNAVMRLVHRADALGVLQARGQRAEQQHEVVCVQPGPGAASAPGRPGASSSSSRQRSGNLGSGRCCSR